MAQNTKLALEQSLKNMLLKKPLNKTTISDITKDCGMNRMTFYYHFKDIYDLVQWACLEDVRQALDHKVSYDNWQQGYLQLFEVVRENKSFVLNVYKSIHQEQVENCLKPQMDRLILSVISQEMESGQLQETDKAFIARVYSYVFLGMMMDWIEDDMREDPANIVNRVGVLMKGTVSDAIARFLQNEKI